MNRWVGPLVGWPTSILSIQPRVALMLWVQSMQIQRIVNCNAKLYFWKYMNSTVDQYKFSTLAKINLIKFSLCFAILGNIGTSWALVLFLNRTLLWVNKWLGAYYLSSTASIFKQDCGKGSEDVKKNVSLATMICLE